MDETSRYRIIGPSGTEVVVIAKDSKHVMAFAASILDTECGANESIVVTYEGPSKG